MEIVYATEELDTLMAAYLAYCVANFPQDTILIGDREEGQIALPVSSLKERYS
jgi:predicted RNase H-like nuclease